MRHQSIATIHEPEFINLEPLDINPLMSRCEIKVLYIGKNRNRTFISRETAAEMAKTLRGAPIVGYYREDKEDFADHGNRVIIDDDGIKFEKLTKPYGFVAPDARVWFQEFSEQDEFGNEILREYLMTTGYLWTEQFPECKVAITEGRGQSMELDEKTLDGNWAEDYNSNVEFFIIHDAIFSQLCILGEEVEPCFEGASVTAPEVSKNFSLVDDTFKNTLFTMMQELRFALKEGDATHMEENTNIVEETTEFTAEDAEVAVTEEVVEPITAEEVAEPAAEENAPTEEFVEVTEETEPVEEVAETVETTEFTEEEPAVEEPVIEEPSIADEYAALQATHEQLIAEHTALQNQYTEMESRVAELTAFKNAVEEARKDEMISKFYMLSDDDKAEVIAHKSEYSLEEIEEKLSVICFRKKVNFDLTNSDENEDNTEHIVSITYNLDEGASTPAWLAAVNKTKSNRTI